MILIALVPLFQFWIFQSLRKPGTIISLGIYKEITYLTVNLLWSNTFYSIEAMDVIPVAHNYSCNLNWLKPVTKVI